MKFTETLSPLDSDDTVHGLSLLLASTLLLTGCINRLTGNQFINTGISGLQIASRQGRIHSPGWCASLNGWPGKFTDTSEGNIVSGNTFVCSEGTSLVVYDGPNVVSDNTTIAREECVPFEISTGGHGRSQSQLLDGLSFRGNSIDATRPPRLRNLSTSVTIND